MFLSLEKKYQFTIDKAIFHKIRKELDLTILLNNVLSVSDFFALKREIDEFLISFDFKYNLYIKYKNNSLDNYGLEYVKYFLTELSKQNLLFKSLIDSCIKQENNVFTFEDVNVEAEQLFPLVQSFKSSGLHVSFNVKTKEIKKVNDIEIKEVKLADVVKTKSQKNLDVVNISSFPLKEEDITNKNYHIQGSIFDVEIKKMSKNNLLVFKIYDGTDSILCKKWSSSSDLEALSSLKEDSFVDLVGYCVWDTYDKTVVFNVNTISELKSKATIKKEDLAPIKRVELHMQSKMSVLDGLDYPKDIIKKAISYNHKAIAITDLNGVYNIPDIANSIKGTDFKPIYGVKMNYIDDTNYYITEGSSNELLKNLTYVVFDIETTGLRLLQDEIIELAAVKMTCNEELEKFECFIKPTLPITQKISELTNITEDDVKNAKSIEEIIPSFLNFIDGCVLVAHNSQFDVGMLKSVLNRLNIPVPNFLVIDTLNVFRGLHHDKLQRFNLKELAKFYKVKQEQHHRAIDDTRVTAEAFRYMLLDLYVANIYTFSEIKKLLTDKFYETQIPKFINILVKNQTGLKNLYKIISYASTTYCAKEPLLLRSLLEQHREGLLVGSGYLGSEVFDEAFYFRREQIENMFNFYDYIEVNPISCFKHLFEEIYNPEDSFKELITFIIKTAKKMNKLVVATSDAYYLDIEDKKYRDILINSPKVGGGFHHLVKYNEYPDAHFRTTEEMMEEFSFLPEEDCLDVVITNTNKICDEIEFVEAFPKAMFAPKDDEFKDSLGVNSITEEMRKIVKEALDKMYGNNPHPLVLKRLNQELDSIINNGYSSVYYISSILVKKSLDDGYLVGSRGSVGSSLVATLMSITEINPLPPHYLCKKCHFQEFKMTDIEKAKFAVTNKYFEHELSNVLSGYDLDDKVCPICKNVLHREGHDIPFETFLGFDGDKTPDIDLNFSGDYQSTAHEFVRSFIGKTHAYRSGTVATLADRNAFGYVKAYVEKKQLNLRPAEIDRLSKKLVGIRRSTGQHPGGIIVVPNYKEIFDVTPYQYPADNVDSDWFTTHFDYHSFENNLLKLDILGHDDPTIIKYLMDYVKEHPSDFPFSRPEDIPINDKNVYKLFSGTDIINIDSSDIDSEVASFAVPEFGTPFVRKLLVDTKPKTFADLVKISGLSHGTGVWVGNAQELVLGNLNFGKIEFSSIIGCRDDIMVYLLYQNLEPLKAFDIMEFVRKGKTKYDKAKWEEYKTYMKEKNVSEWYIWSCEQIEYMFPKAHATAYVLMALRIAWFKVYAKELFYSSWFSKRAKAHAAFDLIGGTIAIKHRLKELTDKKGTKKDEDLINALQVALEASLRGIKFLPVDIYKSDVDTYLIESDGLRCPFTSIDGLGDAAAKSIIDARLEKPFTSIDDFITRTKVTKTIIESLKNMNAFGSLDDKDSGADLLLKGIFSFA